MAAAIEQQVAAPADVENLFTAHHLRVLKAAYRITGSMADAEDVAQTVFLRVVQNAEELHRIENPASYLYRAGINTALDLLRKRQAENAVPLEGGMSTAAQFRHGVDAGELRSWLRQALAQLGPRAAEMFVLRYVENFGNRDIAAMLETSPAVVAVILFRTRARLRKQFRAYMRGKQ